MFIRVDTGRSAFRVFFLLLLLPPSLPLSQLWNPCFKITIVRSPECRTDNPICSQTWGSCTHHFENHSSHPMEKGMATPGFLPGEFYGQRSLASYSPWDRKESDMTKRLTVTYSLKLGLKFWTHGILLIPETCLEDHSG